MYVKNITGKRNNGVSKYMKTILVVDDDPDMRTLLRNILEGAGYEVSEAVDGEDAVDLMSENPCDVALLDIAMPGASGLEVLSWITENAPGVCPVMVTASVDVSTAIEAMKLGAYDYLTKPFSSRDVLNKINVSIMRKDKDNEEKNRVIELERTITEKTSQLLRQFAELVDTLAREHALLYRITQNQTGIFQPEELPLELRSPLSSSEEFSEALLRMLRRQLEDMGYGKVVR